MTTSTPNSSAPTAMRRAKEPRTVLAGPYGHPFHPVLVTIPIGAWVASLVFDLAAVLGEEPEVFAEGAYWLIGVGIVGALAAAVFGLMDLSTIARGTKAFSTGLVHMTLNLTVVGLYVVNFAVRRAQGYDDVGAVALALSLVALAMLGASGWLGGKLAYHYGVRVADEEKQAEGFR
jgi:uncharacterized membrane protein